MKLTIKCKCCNGTGKAPLPKKLQEVVDVVVKLRACSVPAIFKTLPDDGLTITSCNKKVSRLVNMGVLKITNPGEKMMMVRLAK